MNKHIKELKERIEKLEIKEKYVGELYGIRIRLRHGTYIYPLKFNEIGEWLKFKQLNIQDKVDGYTKIAGEWFSNDCIFYYQDVYTPIKKKLQGKIQKKLNKKGDKKK